MIVACLLDLAPQAWAEARAALAEVARRGRDPLVRAQAAGAVADLTARGLAAEMAASGTAAQPSPPVGDHAGVRTGEVEPGGPLRSGSGSHAT